MHEFFQYFGLKIKKISFFYHFRPLFLIVLAYWLSAYFVFSAFPDNAHRQILDKGIWCQNETNLSDLGSPENGGAHSLHDQVKCCFGQAPSSDLVFSAVLVPISDQLSYRTVTKIGSLVRLPASRKYAINFQSRAPPDDFSKLEFQPKI